MARPPNPPFQLRVMGDDHAIQLQIIDGSGEHRVVASKKRVKVGTWYHVAATCTGDSLKLSPTSRRGFVKL